MSLAVRPVWSHSRSMCVSVRRTSTTCWGTWRRVSVWATRCGCCDTAGPWGSWGGCWGWSVALTAVVRACCRHCGLWTEHRRRRHQRSSSSGVYSSSTYHAVCLYINLYINPYIPINIFIVYRFFVIYICDIFLSISVIKSNWNCWRCRIVCGAGSMM